MTWLPKELPPHVHLIVSLLPDEQYECIKHLQKAFKDKPKVFLSVPTLPETDATVILEHWYNNAFRTLTAEQYDVVLGAFKQCSLPLYLRIVFNESLRWPSYLEADSLKLPTEVKKVVVLIFGRLEKDLGEPFIRRALGYMTAAKNGFTTNEMEDLLSLDEAVMDDISKHAKLPCRRVPSLHWQRLLSELGEYIEQTCTDNTVTNRWAHNQFREAAKERYLDQRDKAPSYHKAVGEYFLEKWLTKPKPHSGHGNGSLRHVLPQPLYWDLDVDGKEGTRRVYNLRRLNELPYHLLMSQQFRDLKKECLCNFEFMLAKICGSSLSTTFDDIHTALHVEPGDGDLKLLSDTLHLSTQALIRDPRQLASQVIGRLSTIIAKDVPIAPADPVKFPYMKHFFKQATKASTSALIPSSTCLTPPGGVLFDLLSGHNEPITAVITTSDGQRAVTTSKDNTMKVWELKTGRVTKTLTGVGVDVLAIRLASGNSYAITSELSCIRVWNLNNGTLLSKIEDIEDAACITTANDGQLLVSFFDGSSTVMVWNLEGPSVTLTRKTLLEDTNEAIHKDNSILVAINSAGPFVLYAYRGTNKAKVWNAKTGNLARELVADNGSVTALAVSREYFVVAVRMQYMKLHEIYQLDLFDVRSGQYVRGVRGCVNDHIKAMYVNQLGSHVLAISTSEANNTSDIAVWNVETEDHKHLARHSRASAFGACVDLRFFLTASKGENTLRIWNLSSKINQHMPKEKAKEGLEHIIPMVKHPKYVVAKSMLNGPLAVWNLASTKCSASAVRIERGLVDSNDILLVHNTKAIILTDKGFSGISEYSPPVFKTILIYDLVQKKYSNKKTSCYIVPSQPHEYVFLSDDLLMGLSENRSHFVIWSLTTGYVVHRIKANLKDFEPPKDLPITDDKDGLPSKRHNPTAQMLPWERRSETETARQRRHQDDIDAEKERIESMRKERDNAMEQYLISQDLSTIVASYYAHHMCVFDVPSNSHIQTLENLNSMLFLHVAALTADGSHLVHANYDDDSKVSYVTLWDCQEGFVRKRLKNEKDVSAIAISDNADKVVFGKTNNELRIWYPHQSNSLRRIKGYAGLKFGVGSKIFITNEGQQAVVYAGDISVWDLDNCSVIAIFSPDMKIHCFTMSMNTIVFGLRDTSDIITMRLSSKGTPDFDKLEPNLFGEKTDSSDDEDDESDEDDD